LSVDTNFSVLRRRLEAARVEVRGDDVTSRKVREALDVLIEGVILAEHSRKQGTNIIQFPMGVRAP
jgi:hypothetical protein